MAKAVTLTINPSLDLSALTEKIVPDEKVRCTDVKEDPGGGGVNVARALHRLRVEARAIFPCGGVYGERLRELVEEEGVASETISIEGLTRVNPSVRESEGEQYRFVLPGPELSREEWERCLDALEEALQEGDLFVASGSIPPGVPDDFYRRATERAHSVGAKVVLDAKGDLLRNAIGAGPDWIKPNRSELSDMLGVAMDDEQFDSEVAEMMKRSGVKNVLLSLGSEGARYFSQDRKEAIPSPSVQVKSRTGAGDTMVAGLVYGLLEGKDAIEACRWAVAAGGAAVMTPGTELLRLEDFQELAQNMSTEAGEG